MRDPPVKLPGAISSDLLDHQAKLRCMIIKVHSDPNLSALEKAKRVQVGAWKAATSAVLGWSVVLTLNFG